MATADDDVGVETLSLSDEDTTGTGTKPTGGGYPPNNDAMDRGDDFTPTPDDDDDGEGSADGAASGKKASGIPPERLNEVTQKRREAEERATAAEAENARLRAELEQAKSGAKTAEPAPAAAAASAAPTPQEAVADQDASLKAKQEEAANALLEGDMKRYTEIQTEIFGIIEERATARAMRQSAEASAQANEQAAITAVAATAIAQYPFLDTKTGNAEAIQDVKDMRDLYMSRGMRPSEALQQAVAKVAPLYGGKPAPAAADGGISDPRPGAAAARGASIDSGQPPIPTGGLGERATAGRVNVASMSEKEFASLSEAEKKRMRGD